MPRRWFNDGAWRHIFGDRRHEIASTADGLASESPSILATYGPISNPWDLDVQDQLAYVMAQGDATLHVIDVSDPVNPAGVGTYTFPDGEAREIVVEGDYAYASEHTSFDGKFVVLDISDPANIAEVGAVITNQTGQPVALDKSGDYVVMASGQENNLTVIDVSDPANPVQVGYEANPDYSSVYGVDFVGSYAYVAIPPDGWRIVDINTPSSPSMIGWSTYDAYDVRAVGDWVFMVSDSYDKMYSFDTTDKTNPVQVGVVSPLDGTRSLDTPGDGYAYATGDGFLAMVDITDPANLAEVGRVTSAADLGGIRQRVKVHRTHAYVVANASDKLTIVE